MSANDSFNLVYLIIETLLFTFPAKVFAGLKAGILCAGILTAVFFDMLRPVFSARVLIIKLPKPESVDNKKKVDKIITKSIEK